MAAALEAEAPAAEQAAPPVEQAAPAAEKAESADPAVEADYYKLLEQDEEALQAVERIVKEAREFEQLGTPTPRAAILAKIEQTIQPVEKAYQAFIDQHPRHVSVRIAYASFLEGLGEEARAIEHLEKARELDPNNPTPWNNLAHIYGHIGPVRKSFHYLTKAIELNPNEPVYVQNLATTTYLFRRDAMEMYRITEQEVFDKALALYRRAIELDPDNFPLRTDYAQSYYGIRPWRTEDALKAWEGALKLAKNDLEKEGVYLHFARVQLNNGRFEEAEQNLDRVKHPDLQDLKDRLIRNLKTKREEADQKPAEKEPAEPAGSPL